MQKTEVDPTLDIIKNNTKKKTIVAVVDT